MDLVQVQSLLNWLTALPPATLLLAMGLLAAAENVFPPIPADMLIALGAFLAARADASPWPSYAVVLGGNIAGAMMMYAVGPYALPFERGSREEGDLRSIAGPAYAAPLAATYCNYRKVSIYGGSNEIQKNIIAKAVLGL